MSIVGVLDIPGRQDWMDRRSCRENPDLWFAPAGQAGKKDRNAAKAICGKCEVIDECRRFVLVDRPRYGTWAAMGPSDLQVFYRKHPR